MDEGKITHLRHEKASVSGADGAKARVNETEPRGRQSPHGPCLQSPSRGRREARSVFSLAGARCRGPGGKLGPCCWTRGTHTDTRDAQEASLMGQMGVSRSKSCQK